MNDLADIIIPEVERQRQAVASIRGYVYQIVASALAWAALAEDEVLLLEVADDFSIATSEALTLTQVKDVATGPATTLRTTGVVDTINGFWRLRNSNRARRVRAVYMTTATFGRERGGPLPAPTKGLDEWRLAALEGRDLTGLKALLLSLPLDTDLLSWLEQESDAVIREELLRRMRWEGGQPDLAQLDELLADRLALTADRLGLMPSDGRRARDAILYAVMRRIVDPDTRQLTRAQFLETFEAATSVSMPMSAVRRGPGPGESASATSRLGEILIDARVIPASPLHIERTAITQAASSGLSGGAIVWLHASSGGGKTTAARDVVRMSNRGWYLIELRDLKPEAVAERLRLARQATQYRDFGGLILDDVPAAGLPRLALQFALLSEAVRQVDGGLVVTAYRPPPPSLSNGVVPFGLPPLEETEVGQIVARAGGDAARWMRSVWLSSGGHPQLVAARITGLKARGWPTGEDLQGILPGDRALDLDLERDAVRERLIEDLPDRPRSLLYRLSLLIGGFDRGLAVAAGAATPALGQPGDALDFLVGPWIETARAGRFRVSPLVADAGSRTLSAPEQTAVHAAICDDLLARRPIPGEHVAQLLLSGLVADHVEALKAIGVFVMTVKDENRDILFEHLEPLTFFSTETPLVKQDPEAACLARLAQLKVAVARSPAKTIRRILGRLRTELSGSKRPGDILQAALFTVLSGQTASLPPADWFGLVREMEGLDLRLPVETRDTLRARTTYAGSEQPADFMFTWRTAHLQSIDELEGLFTALDDVDPAVRDRYLATLNDTAATVRSAIQSPWVRDADADGFDAVAAAARYIDLQAIAERWARPEITVQCIAARTTLLSEYADRHDDALAVLETAELSWPGNPLLQRERIKIFFRLGRHEAVVEQTRRFLGQEAGDAIDRAHMLRELAVSTHRLGDPAEAARLFGEAAAEAALIPTMTDMQAGLLGDQAQVEFETGRREAALRTLIAAARVADGLDREARRGEFVTRMLAGLAAWMVNRLAGGDDDAAAVKLGGCSGAAIDADWPQPVPQKEALWYQAAAVERQLGLDIGVRAEVQARVRDRRIAAFEVAFGFSRLEDAALGSSIDHLVDALRNAARIVAHIDRGGLDDVGAAIHQVCDVMPWEALPVDLAEPRIRAPIDDAVAVFVVGNVLRDPVFNVTAVAERLETAPDTALLGPTVRRWDGLLTPDLDALPASLAAAALIVRPPTADASLLMLASFRIWEWLERSTTARRLEATLAGRVSAHWSHLADRAQFALRTPILTAPVIRQAARDMVDRRSLGRLMLAANEAVRPNLGADVLTAIRATLA